MEQLALHSHHDRRHSRGTAAGRSGFAENSRVRASLPAADLFARDCLDSASCSTAVKHACQSRTLTFGVAAIRSSHDQQFRTLPAAHRHLTGRPTRTATQKANTERARTGQTTGTASATQRATNSFHHATQALPRRGLTTQQHLSLTSCPSAPAACPSCDLDQLKGRTLLALATCTNLLLLLRWHRRDSCMLSRIELVVLVLFVLDDLGLIHACLALRPA